VARQVGAELRFSSLGFEEELGTISSGNSLHKPD
jgi:hypothetical protein